MSKYATNILSMMIFSVFILCKSVYAQYLGGNEDGYGMDSVTQVGCPAPTFPAMYAGGSEDGQAMDSVTQVGCPAPTFPAMYAGGNEDGNAMDSITQVGCLPPVYPVMYVGGNEDGYAMDSVTQVGCPPPIYPAMYAGGNEDGYAMDSMSQISCSSPVYPFMYLGGVEDGAGSYMSFPACDPIVDFYGTPLAICTGNSINFFDTSTYVPAPTGWSWTFSGGTPATSTAQNPSITYNTPGTYDVSLTITGAFGTDSIMKTGYVIVANPPAVSITPLDTTTFCQGDSVQLLATVGFSSYTWSNGDTTQTTTITTSGSYNVTVSDGCPGSATAVTVTVNAVPTATITPSGPTNFCTGDSVILTASPVDSFFWSPTGDTTQAITVFSSGTYFMTATSSNGCSATSAPTTVSVSSTSTPTITPSGSTTICSDDSVILTSSPAVTYSWSPGGDTTQAITVTAAGTYFVTTDTTGCGGASAPETVTVNSVPTAIITASGPTSFCAGDSVILTAAPVDSFLWSPTGDTTQAITVFSSGTYFMTATSSNGCSAISAPTTVLVSPSSTPTITPSGSTTICSGDSVVLTSSPAATYSWSPGGDTIQAITVTTAGTYFVTTDIASCGGVSMPETVSVNAVPIAVITPGGATTFCTGDSVILTASPADNYFWSPGGDTTQTITVSGAGSYFVVVTDTNSCSAISTAETITVNSMPTATITPSGSTTFCQGDSVILTANLTDSYLWTPGNDTTQSITVSTTGNYFVMVTDASGCSATSLITTVSVSSVPTAIITASGSTTFCQGDSVILSANLADSYLWSPGNDTMQSITVSTTGNYFVIATDTSGCNAISSPTIVSVLSVPVATITSSGSTTFCQGDSVILSANLADSYLWTPGNDTTQSITVSATGNYFVMVSDTGGCSATSSLTTITVNSNPTPTITGQDSVCQNTIETYGVTNISDNSYNWTVIGGTVFPSADTNVISITWGGLGTGTVSIQQTDTTTGCAAITSLNISILDAPNANAGNDIAICASADSVQLLATGGVNYIWSPSIGLSNSTIANPMGAPDVTTMYIVTVFNGSCFDTDTVTVTINSLPLADAGIDVNISNDSCAVLNASGGTAYSWSPATGLDNFTSQSPTACPTITTVYYVTVTDINGCIGVDSVTATVVTTTEGIINIPNTFSPNSDGVNDMWEIKNITAYINSSLNVYNRWGNKVYDAKPYLNNWDGKSLGKDLPDATYYYILDLGDGTPVSKGNITIIR